MRINIIYYINILSLYTNTVLKYENRPYTLTYCINILYALSARGKSTVVCRVRRSYREGDPTWIDIANDRKLWTSLVYELFHDAKNY